MTNAIRALGCLIVFCCLGSLVLHGPAHAADPPGGGFMYDGKFYQNEAAICRAWLQIQNPPEELSKFEPLNANGDIHCTGTAANGGTPWDQSLMNVTRVKPGLKSAAPSSAPSPPSSAPPGNLNDRCLDGPAADRGSGRRKPPDETRCPLSYRAFEITQELGRRGVQITRIAISVSEGMLKDGTKVRLVTTNSPELWKSLSKPDGKLKAVVYASEQLGTKPLPVDQPHMTKNSSFEHAEDVALRFWIALDKDKALDTAAGVRMGTDPKACQWCAEEYETPRKPYDPKVPASHDNKEVPAWLQHERLKF